MTRIVERQSRIDEKTGQDAARRVLDATLAQLGEWRVSPDALTTVQIALAEALNNVFEHAYGFRSGEGFSLDMSLRDDLLTCTIRDHGTPFPGGTPPEGAPVELDGPTSTLPEGGFGWFMIRQMTESLDYKHVQGCNILTLRFRVV